jgi:hypothetical protein
MDTDVGLWIDHRKAVIVRLADQGETIREVRSHAERQPRRYGGPRPEAPGGLHGGPPDDILERDFRRHLDAYYDNVILHLRDARSILIFGPGEAKGELKKRLGRNRVRGHVVGLETTDKMTDRQIAAKVRVYFGSQDRV